ncbi:MAG: ABC transporter permease [Chloroflexi bacterium]|nr:ABC transporter permease [Chloroflexota bacterium]
MSRLEWYLRVTWTTGRMYLAQVAVDQFAVSGIVLQPLFVALLAIYMLRDTPGFQAIYVIVGSGMTGLWTGTLFFNTNGILAERWSGSLEYIVGSSTHLSTIVVGKSTVNVLLSLTSMLFCYPFAAYVFGYSISINEPLAFGVSLVLTALALLSLGMVIAPLMALRPGSEIWLNVFEFPMYIVGGFLFPIALLPAWTTPISYALAPYWAARALHATSSGAATLEELVLCWGMLIASCVIYWFLSAWLFRTVLRRTLIEASLSRQ